MEGFRYATNHAQETKEVKAALIEAGLPVKSVRHGQGTAWGWLEINLGPNPGSLVHIKGNPDWLCRLDCPACDRNRKLIRLAVHTTQEFTGRHGDYDGEIQVLTQ